MHTIIQAVVLRQLQVEPPTIALYTAPYGRITVHDMRRAKSWAGLVVGDVCQASVEVRGSRWILNDLESALTRRSGCEEESFFWHAHLLDMYFHYVPLQQPSEDLFFLLVGMLRVAAAPTLVFKLFIAHFFSLLGYYVPQQLRWYRQILAKVEEQGIGAGISEESVLELDEWLRTVVMQHDHFRQLKSRNFLNQLYHLAGPRP